MHAASFTFMTRTDLADAGQVQAMEQRAEGSKRVAHMHEGTHARLEPTHGAGRVCVGTGRLALRQPNMRAHTAVGCV